MIVVLLGSARRDGNTRRLVDAGLSGRPYEVIDLARAEIRPYRYEGDPPADDFLPIVRKMTAAELVVFATPVYWYAMSGPMKTFFDRLTDLLGGEDSLASGLEGTPCCLISTGTDEALPEGFAEVFSRTAAYLGMEYRGSCYATAEEAEHPSDRAREQVRRFVEETLDGTPDAPDRGRRPPSGPT